jgi:hypothetical protein
MLVRSISESQLPIRSDEKGNDLSAAMIIYRFWSGRAGAFCWRELPAAAPRVLKEGDVVVSRVIRTFKRALVIAGHSVSRACGRGARLRQ